MKLILWHGSIEIVEKPTYGLGKKNNDYGLGFYCTQEKDLAKEWACQERGRDGYASCYELEMNELSVLNLSESKYTILNWLALLVNNRDFRVSTPIGRQGKDYLLKHFLIDISSYDVIIGYRADDAYFSFARAFVNNEISLNQLERAMHLGKLGEQIVIKSAKAFSSLTFMKYEIADSEEYFGKRQRRSTLANREFLNYSDEEDIHGLFMRDIILEGVENNDSRLR